MDRFGVMWEWDHERPLAWAEYCYWLEHPLPWGWSVVVVSAPRDGGQGEQRRTMKVTAIFKDGSFREVTISSIILQMCRGPADAIKEAGKLLRPDELEQVKSWEVKDEFLP